MDDALKNGHTIRKKPVAVVRDVQCTGCGICASVCPVPCIEIVDIGLNFTGTASINGALCTGCNFCAIDCPWDAIVMVDPDGSEKVPDIYGKQVRKMRGYA